MNKIKIFQRLPYPLRFILVMLNSLKLYYWRNGNRKKHLAELKTRMSWTAEDYQRWQVVKLKEVLNFTAKNVPYYINYWKDKNETDYLNLENWPIIEKEVIRSNPNLFVSKKLDLKDLYKMNTSGSSGKPMTFWLTRETLSIWYAMYELRIRNWNGVNGTQRYGAFGGQLIVNINKSTPPYWIWNPLMNQLYFSSYHINLETVEQYVEAIKKHKLSYLLGYVSSIYSIAVLAKEKRLELPKLKLIITNAEPLFEYQRDLLETAFGCKVVQTYSGCEYAFGGSEDLSGNMYLWPEAGILEVQQQDGKLSTSGTGEFIITGLLNLAMPLIRYRVGDSGTVCKYSEENSISNMNYLSEISGRTDDLIVTREGRIVGRLDPIFKSEFNIMEAQIIQKTYDEFIINIVPSPGFSESEAEELKNRLIERVGESNIEIIQVVSIPRGSNGKFKAVISNVNKQI